MFSPSLDSSLGNLNFTLNFFSNWIYFSSRLEITYVFSLFQINTQINIKACKSSSK